MQGERLGVKKLLINIIAYSLVVIWMLPFIGLVIASFEPMYVVCEGWWKFEKLTLENYRAVLERGFMKHIENSLLITAGSVIIPIIVAGLAAYGFSRFSFRLKTLLFIFIVLLQVLPQQMVIVPLRYLLTNTKLYNTYLGIILVHSAFAAPWMTFFIKSFIDYLPPDYEDAARVDGASDTRIFFEIVLPILKPAFGSVAAIQAIWAWNDLLFSIMFLMPSHWPAVPAITQFVSRYNPNWGLLTASSVLAMVIPVALYFTVQRYYIKAMFGGIKM